MSPTHAQPSPRFCPECRTAVTDPEWDRPFCARCGGSLVDQGYCDICERHWRLPVGERCPKHEIALEEQAHEVGMDPAVETPFSWQTIQKFPHSLAAAGARIRLEAEGIPTFIDGERMGSPSMYGVATGGVKLQVPAHLASDARVILDQTWMARPPDDPDDDIDDAWDDLSGSAGSSTRSVGELMRLVEAFLLLLMLGPVVLWVVARLLGLV